MQKFFLVFSFFLIHNCIFTQSIDLEGKIKAKKEELKEKSKEEDKDTLNTDYYKIFYLDGRIDNIDTTLNIYKDYKFNFLREDSFDLISFANSAHTYNKLAYNFRDFSKPDVGVRGKHFHYFEKEDIGYYNVPT